MILKEEIIKLWRDTFDDTEEFIRFYFDRKYREENTVVAIDNEELLAALQMIPYPMTWLGKEVSASYISGACTRETARNKGIMRSLLAEAFITMKNRDIAFSILIPQEEWLYDYYAKSGYAPVLAYTPGNYYLHGKAKSEGTRMLTAEEWEAGIKELYHYFDRQMKKRPDCVQHTPEDFRHILEDLYRSGGKLATVSNPLGKLTGMAFALPLPDKIAVNEIVYSTEEAHNNLLHAIANEWGKNEIACRYPPGSGKNSKRGMARIIDAPQVLSLYAATQPQKSLLLRLTDEAVPSNSGYYRITNGKCFNTGPGVGKTDLDLSVAELTRFLFAQPAFVSLMLD